MNDNELILKALASILERRGWTELQISGDETIFAVTPDGRHVEAHVGVIEVKDDE